MGVVVFHGPNMLSRPWRRKAFLRGQDSADLPCLRCTGLLTAFGKEMRSRKFKKDVAGPKSARALHYFGFAIRSNFDMNGDDDDMVG